MSDFKNIFSPIMFAILIICFFLPFFNLTCQNQKIASVTGYDLMTGTSITPPDMYNTASQQESLAPEPLAIIAFVLGLGALFMSFFRKGAFFVAAASILGVVSLLLLSSKINDDIASRIELQGLTLEWAVGMWVSLLIFAVSTVLNLYLSYDNKYRPVDLDEYTQRMKLCAICGAANERGNVYCSKCGNMLA